MQRFPLLVLALAACARTERGAANLAQQMTGTWEGRSFRSASDTAVPWTNVLTVGSDGALTGSLTFTGTNQPPVAMRMVALTDSTISWELGPFYSPTVGAEVTSRTEARYAGDSLWGTFEARPTAGGEPVRGTFAAKRTQRAP